MFNFIFKFGVTMGALLAAAVVAVLGVGAFWMQPPTTATQDVTFVVLSGAGLRTVAAELEAAELINSADQIILLRDQTCIAGSPEELAGGGDEGVIEFLGEDGRSFLARRQELEGAAP